MMNLNPFNLKNLVLLLAVGMAALLTSCGDDFEGETKSFSYSLHTGQTVPSAAYAGSHPTDYSVDMELTEMENGNTMITLTLNNTVDGETYNLHAHDGADAASTPNGTPYNESPNANIFAQAATGNGESVTVSQEATMSFTELTETYSGFFVSHDPLQGISTTDITTYLVVGAFAR